MTSSLITIEPRFAPTAVVSRGELPPVGAAELRRIVDRTAHEPTWYQATDADRVGGQVSAPTSATTRPATDPALYLADFHRYTPGGHGYASPADGAPMPAVGDVITVTDPADTDGDRYPATVLEVLDDAVLVRATWAPAR